MIEALDIQVKGIVQGVGFRPFVYRLAKKYQLNGWVLNAVEGVFIHAEGEANLLDKFVTELHMNPPSAAKVKEIDLKEVPLEGFGSSASPTITTLSRPRWFPPIWLPVTTALMSCSTPQTAATATRSSTARTAARASPSSGRCPMIARQRP